MDDHSSGTPVTGRLARSTRAAARKRLVAETTAPPLFDLAPGGVYLAVAVTGGAVRSYRTLSPLPPGPALRLKPGFGGLLSVALSLGSPPPGVTRHRLSVEPGLSSSARLRKARPQRSSSRLTTGIYAKPACITNARSSASVSASAMPVTSLGRKCRWKALIVAGEESS